MLTLYSTWPDEASARACARALIEARAAACATLLPGAVSIYRWKGAIEADAEVALLVKTSAARAEAACALIVAQHPYELPCVTAWPIQAAGSHRPYLDWIASETESAP